MRLIDFIGAGGIADPAEHIYLLENPAFFRRAGWDVLANRSAPNADGVLFLGFRDVGLEARVPSLHALLAIFEQLGRSPREFVVVLGKHYFEVDDAFAQALPGNVRTVFSCNVNTGDPRIRYFPLGRDFRARADAARVAPRRARDILCYANFSVDTHPVRTQLRDRLAEVPHVTTDHLGKFLEYPMTRAAFLERLQRAKFALCPRGAGIETFRMWDCLYLGVVPVVIDEAVFHRALRGLPILLLRSWDEFLALSAEELERIWAEMLERSFDDHLLKLSTHLLEVYGAFVSQAGPAAA
jgi:hypothetical protein